MTALSFLVLLVIATQDKPTPKLPLGKDTTYVLGPLDKEGYIDYETALNERLRQGIAPKQNANVLLWKAIGPRPEGTPMPQEYFEALGIEAPPQQGDYLVGLQDFLKDHLKLDQAKWAEIEEQRSRAAQRPWTSKDYPHISAWLKQNEKPLAVAIEASKPPHYFNPQIGARTKAEAGGLLGALSPNVLKYRELAYLLTARAMLRVSEGKFDEAWQDLLACHRLGRLVSQGITLIETLVGIAIDQAASNADLALLERVPHTSQQALSQLKDLQRLPALGSLPRKVDLGERLTFLDTFQLVRRGGIGMMEAISGGAPPAKPTPREAKALEKLDWATPLRSANEWYDRYVEVVRIENRTAREKEFERLEAAIAVLKKEAAGSANQLALLLSEEGPDKTVGKAIGNVMIGLLLPAVRNRQAAYDRLAQVQANVQIAFALAAFRADKGHYPAELSELTPRYLPKIPGDLFSGQELVYRPEGKGYLLYSVGANGKDDAGRWTDDDPPGDDIRVRMPLPELKAKK